MFFLLSFKFLSGRFAFSRCNTWTTRLGYRRQRSTPTALSSASPRRPRPIAALVRWRAASTATRGTRTTFSPASQKYKFSSYTASKHVIIGSEFVCKWHDSFEEKKAAVWLWEAFVAPYEARRSEQMHFVWSIIYKAGRIGNTWSGNWNRESGFGLGFDPFGFFDCGDGEAPGTVASISVGKMESATDCGASFPCQCLKPSFPSTASRHHQSNFDAKGPKAQKPLTPWK